VQQIDKQIASYQQQVDKLLLTYTDAYPDVIATRRAITELKARRQALSRHPNTARQQGPDADNPGQRGTQALAAQIAAQKQKIADLKSSADKITDVQVKMQQLTRNYEVTKKQYNQVLTRLNTAQMSQDATQSGNNLKFRVINPPLVPLQPASPKRGLLLSLVFALAIGIGCGFAYFMHKIQPVFMSLKSLREYGGYPVLGAISLIVSESQRKKQRRRVIGFCAAAGLLAVVLVAGLAFAGHFTNLVQHFLVMGTV
jgi:polysaccharide chain length determinant protein (PEP-CTERM system associated)